MYEKYQKYDIYQKLTSKIAEVSDLKLPPEFKNKVNLESCPNGLMSVFISLQLTIACIGGVIFY